MAKLEEINGAAVATVNVPAHKAQVVVAQSSIEGCAIAAAEAWDKVRGKGPGSQADADFASATREFRQHLINSAEEVYKTGKALEGDTVQARFERELLKIKGKQDEAKKAAAAKAEKE